MKQFLTMFAVLLFSSTMLHAQGHGPDDGSGAATSTDEGRSKFKAPVFPHYKKLKPFYKHDLKIDEPSDICATSDNPSHFYVVGNRGNIAIIDSNGNVLRISKQDGGDYEGCCVKDHQLYVFDESLRKITVMDEGTMKIRKNMTVPYAGGRNKGFEGLTYIPSQKKFISVIEKPATIYELNEQLQVINEFRMKGIWELSAVTYHDNFLWLLCDEAHMVVKVNPENYDIVDQWDIPVVNPEGIAFDAGGNLLIVSDDLGKLFKFKIQ
jgi:uncharacterized protein YjiK